MDYIEENRRFKSNQDKKNGRINFIFNPCFNNDVKGFQKDADQLCKYFHVDTLQTNVKEYNGVDYGGTSVIGVENRNVIKRLISEGYRQDDQIEYKLCEANGEMMMIADLYLRGVEVPTHVRSEPRIRIRGGYIYNDKSWEKVDPFWKISSKN